MHSKTPAREPLAPGGVFVALGPITVALATRANTNGVSRFHSLVHRRSDTERHGATPGYACDSHEGTTCG